MGREKIWKGQGWGGNGGSRVRGTIIRIKMYEKNILSIKGKIWKKQK